MLWTCNFLFLSIFLIAILQPNFHKVMFIFSKSLDFWGTDLQKAFDKVSWEKVCKILQQRKMSSKLIIAVKNIYQNTSNYIINNNMKSEIPATRSETRWRIKYYLFMVFMGEIIKDCNIYMYSIKICRDWKYLNVHLQMM